MGSVQIRSGQIADSQIITAKIADSAILSGKIADNAIIASNSFSPKCNQLRKNHKTKCLTPNELLNSELFSNGKSG